jgi:hypothetical protein
MVAVGLCPCPGSPEGFRGSYLHGSRHATGVLPIPVLPELRSAADVLLAAWRLAEKSRASPIPALRRGPGFHAWTCRTSLNPEASRSCVPGNGR